MNSVIPNKISLKRQRHITPAGCKHIEIRIFEFFCKNSLPFDNS